MSKPREFSLERVGHLTYGKRVQQATYRAELSVDEEIPENGLPRKETVRVVEFSAHQAALDEIEKLKNANAVLREKVIKHKEAYGTDIFPNSVKLDNNSTRDSISANMGRHMCDCFLRYMDEALKEADEIQRGDLNV